MRLIEINDGKKVCKGCCDHTSLKPFINNKGQKVCLLCCEHNITDEDHDGGNKYCLDCFVILPQSYCYLPPKLIAMVKRDKERDRKQKELMIQWDKGKRTLPVLRAKARSLGIKGYSKLKKAELEALIASPKD